MSLEQEREKIAEKARQIDSERTEVLQELFHARKKVRELELSAEELGRAHLKQVHSYIRVDQIISPTKPPTTERPVSMYRINSAILQAFEHLELDPEKTEDFHSARAVILWWVNRELPEAVHEDISRAWKKIVGKQETANAVRVTQCKEVVKSTNNHVTIGYQKMITRQVFSDPDQEHQESGESDQSRS